MLRALRALLVFSVLTGVIYPLLVTVGAQVAFSDQADGSLIERSEGIVGSELIGQTWEGDEWFYGRPSAVDHDASASGAANLGPTSAALAELFVDRIRAIRDIEGPYGDEVAVADIPVDLLTASASGLDPHISVEAARFQAPRIAEVRGLSPAQVEALITDHEEARTLGVWGQARVNVLMLNLALVDLART